MNFFFIPLLFSKMFEHLCQCVAEPTWHIHGSRGILTSSWKASTVINQKRRYIGRMQHVPKSLKLLETGRNCQKMEEAEISNGYLAVSRSISTPWCERSIGYCYLMMQQTEPKKILALVMHQKYQYLLSLCWHWGQVIIPQVHAKKLPLPYVLWMTLIASMRGRLYDMFVEKPAILTVLPLSGYATALSHLHSGPDMLWAVPSAYHLH